MNLRSTEVTWDPAATHKDGSVPLLSSPLSSCWETWGWWKLSDAFPIFLNLGTTAKFLEDQSTSQWNEDLYSWKNVLFLKLKDYWHVDKRPPGGCLHAAYLPPPPPFYTTETKTTKTLLKDFFFSHKSILKTKVYIIPFCFLISISFNAMKMTPSLSMVRPQLVKS